MGMNASLVRGRDRNIYIIKLRIFELNGGPTGGRSLEVKPYFTHEELSQKETNNTKKTPKNNNNDMSGRGRQRQRKRMSEGGGEGHDHIHPSYRSNLKALHT